MHNEKKKGYGAADVIATALLLIVLRMGLLRTTVVLCAPTWLAIGQLKRVEPVQVGGFT